MEVLFIATKVLLVALLVSAPFMAFLFKRYKQKSIVLPHSALIYTASLLPVAYLLSALFSDNIQKSLLSYDYNTDSMIMLLLGFLTMLLTVFVVINKCKISKLFSAGKFLTYTISIIIVWFVLQVVLQLFGVHLPWWLAIIQPVGSWLNVSALIALLLMLIPDFIKVDDEEKTKELSILPVMVTIVLSLLLAVYMNATFIMLTLTVVALLSLIKQVVNKNGNFNKTLVYVLGAIVLINSVFLADLYLFNAKISNYIQSASRVSFVDVRPNWQGTLTVAQNSLTEPSLTKKLFGSGAGTFGEQWRLYKPAKVIYTPYWGTTFNYAIGYIPTNMITGGIVSILAWSLFLLTLAVFWYKNRKVKYAKAVLFAWIFMFFGIVDPLMMVFIFYLTGLFVVEAVRAHNVKLIKFNFDDGGINRVVKYVVVPTLFISAIAVVGFTAHRSIVDYYLQKASTAMAQNRFNDAEQILQKVDLLADNSIIEQGYTQIALVHLSDYLKEQAKNKDSKPDAKKLQDMLANVLSHARKAIELDSKDPANYLALGSISEQLMSMKIDGAKESALASYNQALKLDPGNPAILMAISRVYARDKDQKNMTKYIEQALKLKPNYIPALYQYGLLKLADKDVKTAQQAFTAVVRQDANNANALYYLGLIFAQQKQYTNAYILINRVAQLNPDNKEVKKLAEKFKALAIEQQKQANQATESASTSTTENTKTKSKSSK